MKHESTAVTPRHWLVLTVAPLLMAALPEGAWAAPS